MQDIRGPIDFIIVGFEGNEFDGSIMQSLTDALDKGVIGLIAMSVIRKDDTGKVTTLSLADTGEEYLMQFSNKYKPTQPVEEADIEEVSELLKNNTAAGMLIIEHLWAIPLKKALLKANGELIAEGRIHPEAAMEMSKA
ncbi:MAG TPA: DUF6325 family protein [Candidatus Saccharimonadales bacterium]|nr:DUF6325 family protein [Candidatus Saccharimonadales bacterium]